MDNLMFFFWKCVKMDVGDFMEQLNRSELRKKIMTIFNY